MGSKKETDVHSPSFSSPDYSPGIGLVLIEQESTFQGTQFTIAIPHNYEHPSSSTGVMSPELLRSLFQWSHEEGEASGYASFVIVSSIQTRLISASIADNNNNDDLHRRFEAQ